MVVLFVFNWHIQFQTYPAKFLLNLLQPHISSRSTVTDTFTFFEKVIILQLMCGKLLFVLSWESVELLNISGMY